MAGGGLAYILIAVSFDDNALLNSVQIFVFEAGFLSLQPFPSQVCLSIGTNLPHVRHIHHSAAD